MSSKKIRSNAVYCARTGDMHSQLKHSVRVKVLD